MSPLFDKDIIVLCDTMLEARYLHDLFCKRHPALIGIICKDYIILQNQSRIIFVNRNRDLRGRTNYNLIGAKEFENLLEKYKEEHMEKIKSIIKEYFDDARCGLFYSRNCMGDRMTTIYSNERVTIDICYDYAYFEVFGLNADEQQELRKYYKELEKASI